jgi:hypothetical protein
MNKLKFALSYVKQGYSVIPLHPNTKIPLIPWKPYTKHIASGDILKNWFGGDDNTNNIGIVTGKVSGIAVIDYDTKDGYREDDTPTVETPKGFHCYYKWREGITNASLGDKIKPIDIRGEGGFVVAPPSTVSDIKYTWLKGKTPKLELKDLPEDMIVPPKVIMNCPSEVGNGNRNNKLFEFCCSEVKLHPYPKYYQKVFNWNIQLAEPLEKEEVERTLDNVYENHKDYILGQLKNLMY